MEQNRQHTTNLRTHKEQLVKVESQIIENRGIQKNTAQTIDYVFKNKSKTLILLCYQLSPKRTKEVIIIVKLEKQKYKNVYLLIITATIFSVFTIYIWYYEYNIIYIIYYIHKIYIFINYYHNTVKQVQLSYSYFKDKETEAQKERILLKVTQLLTVRIRTGIQTDLIPSFIVFYCYKYLIGGDHCKGRYN